MTPSSHQNIPRMKPLGISIRASILIQNIVLFGVSTGQIVNLLHVSFTTNTRIFEIYSKFCANCKSKLIICSEVEIRPQNVQSWSQYGFRFHLLTKVINCTIKSKYRSSNGNVLYAHCFVFKGFTIFD